MAQRQQSVSRHALQRAAEATQTGITIDALDFMRRTSSHQTLIDEDGTRQSFLEAYRGRFYYVKNIGPLRDGTLELRQHERYGWDDASIWLERDTGWPPVDSDPPGFRAFDCLQYRSRTWARRLWTVGDRIDDVRYELMPWNYDAGDQNPHPTCIYDRNFVRSDVEAVELLYAIRDYGGDIGACESIGIKHIDAAGVPYEIHWYARGYGWVEWENIRPGHTVPSVRWPFIPDDSSRCPEPQWKCPKLGYRPSMVAEYYFLAETTDDLIASPPTPWIAGQELSYRVKVRNTGVLSWEATGTEAVRLAVTFNFLLWPFPSDDGERFPLPHAVAVGESAVVEVQVTIPAIPGVYTLRHRMVQGD